MTYRADPALDIRLAALVEGLPARPAPSVAELGGARPYRTPRWVLVLVAVLLVIAAIVAFLLVGGRAADAYTVSIPAGLHPRMTAADAASKVTEMLHDGAALWPSDEPVPSVDILSVTAGGGGGLHHLDRSRLWPVRELPGARIGTGHPAFRQRTGADRRCDGDSVRHCRRPWATVSRLNRRLRSFTAVALASAVLALGCAATWSWANHLEVLPSSLPLACEGVDPFRCHDDASRALAVLFAEAPHVRSSLPMEMREVTVARTDPLDYCRHRHCPYPVIERLELISHQAEVTVRYSEIHSDAAVDTIVISASRDGHVDVQVRHPIHLRVPV